MSNTDGSSSGRRSANRPDAALSSNKGCPICGKRREDRFRPFCSGRCRNIDLGHWLDGSYAIPALEVDDDGAEDAR